MYPAVWPQIHNRYEPKIGAVPLLGEFVPIEYNAWVVVYLRTKSHLGPSSRLATNRHGPTIGVWALFMGSMASHLTQSPRPMPNTIPSGTLIHPAVLPQGTWAEIGVCDLSWAGSWVPI